MAYANGRLPQSALAPITTAANGEQAYLRKDAARYFNAMSSESVRRFGLVLRVTSARVAYRTFAAQEYFWELMKHGGNLAARPGTSNHGNGTTVDLATMAMRSVVDKIGAKYGFAKRWSDAQSEWWHILWLMAHVTAKLGPAAARVLRVGVHDGDDVQAIQVMLRECDCLPEEWKAHRSYTRAVATGVKKFQRRHGMKADGVVGPKTRAKLRAAYDFHRNKKG